MRYLIFALGILMGLTACEPNTAIPPGGSCVPAFDIPCEGGLECDACDDGLGASWFECTDGYVVDAESPDAADLSCRCFPSACDDTPKG